jgi:hypothetical protein
VDNVICPKLTPLVGLIRRYLDASSKKNVRNAVIATLKNSRAELDSQKLTKYGLSVTTTNLLVNKI